MLFGNGIEWTSPRKLPAPIFDKALLCTLHLIPIKLNSILNSRTYFAKLLAKIFGNFFRPNGAAA